MRRIIFVLVAGGGALAWASTGCGTDDASETAVNGGGGASGSDAAGFDAGGTGGTGGSGTGGTAGTSAGGWPSTGGTSAGGASGGAGGNGGASASGGGGSTTAGAAGGGAGSAPCEGQGGSGGPCAFPQGVPDPDFSCSAANYQDTDPAVDAAVNAAMAALSGCNPGSDCVITGVPGNTIDEICQSWFAVVAQSLREEGYCAGQHEVGSTDEIAVSDRGCTGKWYGYHICNYGGGKVVWNPGARRGWWMIEPSHCPP